MFRNSRYFSLLLAFGFFLRGAHAQEPSKPAAKPDYSKEAFVIEQTSTQVAFENDGTGTRESFSRIRIQSEAGVQRYGLLTFSYQNSTENVDVDYVRVLKPDGTVIPTPADNTQDMAAQITREAPFYSDLREKHVAVKGLGMGDVLEFHVQWHGTKPLAPGQFWYAYNFSHDGIILQEQLRISVPRDRPIKWKSPAVKPVITEEDRRRVFTWTSSQLDHKSSEQEKAEQEERLYQAAHGQFPPADAQLSTFQTWDDVGRWYGGLQQERVKPTPEIVAKAKELTQGASDDNAKLHAIYKYVSTEFRYIGIAFGIGRYQPHTAAEVLGNQYGDCKDKHTLFASLLEAAGIKAFPALISSSHQLDPDVPSPGQFDHVISIVPQPSGFLWFDTTTEVSPFAYLVKPLRDKPALVIPEDKPPTLIATPVDPPSKQLQTFKIKATLDDTGTLEGKIERTVQGDDTEILLRSAFRRVPMPQWKDLIQQISYGSGFAGDVSEVTAGSPEKTDEPFHFAYIYKRKDYPNWSSRQVSAPLPPMLAPVPDTRPSRPILLGDTGEIQYESQVGLPHGYSPELPSNVHLKQDFAEYQATYAVTNGVLHTDRRLVIKLREVPPDQYDLYKKFAKAVSDDHELYVALSAGGTRANSLQNSISRLPGSDVPEAARAYDDAAVATQNNNMQGAIDSVKRAVLADPHFTRARIWLSQLYMFTGQRDLALETLRAARDADPDEPVTYKALVGALMAMQKYEEAVAVLREVVKANPQEAEAYSTLGTALYHLKHYDEAAEAVESAVKLRPDQPEFYSQLGYAYLRAGNEDKSTAAFKTALGIDPRPVQFNDIGYGLAEANKQLPLALEYAQKAVREEEESTAKVTLSNLKREDLNGPQSLAAYWDTLGWVFFRMGSLEQAEKYLHCSWVLSQDPTVGGHLGQVYEKLNRRDAAIHLYRLALYRFSVRSGPFQQSDEKKEIESRLEHLNPGASQDSRSMPSTSDELNKMRTFALPRLVPKSASGEFFLLFASGSNVEEVKFVSGSDELKTSDKALRAINFKLPLPDRSPAHVVRRGIVGCYPNSGCSLVLYNPEDVHSVN